MQQKFNLAEQKVFNLYHNLTYENNTLKQRIKMVIVIKKICMDMI